MNRRRHKPNLRVQYLFATVSTVVLIVLAYLTVQIFPAP